MKYYKIKIKNFYDGRIASSANYIDNSNEKVFEAIGRGEILQNTPVFDYFFLESFDEKKYWEWALFDIHHFIGEASKMLGSLLISEKSKKLFENFKIPEPHFFYKSKLLYKNKRYNYYIFQFTGKKIYRELAEYINFSKSEFLNPITEKILFWKKHWFYKEKNNFKKRFDFFPMQSFLKDNLISEALKQAIEENNITGFEFSELDYEVVVEWYFKNLQITSKCFTWNKRC